MKLKNYKKINECPLCNSDKFEYFEFNNKVRFNLTCVECCECGLLYMDTQLLDEDLEEFYKGYNSNRNHNDSHLLDQRRIMYNLDYDFLLSEIKENHNSILDIGGGTGEFINLFESKKIKYIVEVDQESRINAQKNNEDISFYSSIHEVPSDVFFDVIVFRGTLQYMTDLKFTASFINSRLNRNGLVIFLQIPNSHSLLAQLQREEWSLFNRLEHRYYFNLDNIGKFLGSEFNLIKWDFPYLNTPYANYNSDLKSIMSLINEKEVKNKFPFFGSMLNGIYQKI
jgi:SAM-dependent methyltransferase